MDINTIIFSAFVTIWLKHLVSRMVREEGLFGDESSFAQGADLMLRQINRELHDTRLSHHLTLFVGVIDTLTHKMHYVVAGHLPDGRWNALSMSFSRSPRRLLSNSTTLSMNDFGSAIV